MLHLLDSSEEDDSDSSYPKHQPKKSVTPPSGIANLFSNRQYKGESKPLNAFIATTKPPPVQYNSDGSDQDVSSSSYRSSAYFTASLPNSIAEETDPLLPIAIATAASPPSPHHLSRTLSSSNYFDNQSDYEVILDDGTRQKRTVSLSTVQIYPSHSSSNDHSKSNSSNYLSIVSKWMSRKDWGSKRYVHVVCCWQSVVDRQGAETWQRQRMITLPKVICPYRYLLYQTMRMIVRRRSRGKGDKERMIVIQPKRKDTSNDQH